MPYQEESIRDGEDYKCCSGSYAHSANCLETASVQERIMLLDDIGESPEIIAKEVGQPIDFVIAVINGEIPF